MTDFDKAVYEVFEAVQSLERQLAWYAITNPNQIHLLNHSRERLSLLLEDHMPDQNEKQRIVTRQTITLEEFIANPAKAFEDALDAEVVVVDESAQGKSLLLTALKPLGMGAETE